MPLTLKYLRHGKVLSGGARHEEFMFDTIQHELEKRNVQFNARKEIAASIFRRLANLRLIFWGIRHANANINIVVGRLALSSLIRNKFTRNKTLIVFHNYDENDGKGRLLKYYYKMLFNMLASSNRSKVSIITVSPYFQKYFSGKFPNLNVFLFPNLFDTKKYLGFLKERDMKKILLGQYSSKMDKSLFKLADKLSSSGYNCFFCTLREEEVGKYASYEVRKFNFDEYLNEMASSYCSLSLSGVNEGWPRMVHESILVGTPVIGYDKGGLGDLLKESCSYIVQNENEAFDLIKNEHLTFKTPDVFIAKYDSATSPEWIKPLIEYILCS